MHTAPPDALEATMSEFAEPLDRDVAGVAKERAAMGTAVLEGDADAAADIREADVASSTRGK